MDRLLLLSLLVSLASGCSSTPEPMDAGTTTDVDADVHDSGVDGGPPCTAPPEDPFACEDRTPDPACGAHWVVGTTGRIVTSSGDPVENARAQFCIRVAPDDRLVCLFPPQTNANGEFSIIVPEELRCLNRAAMRAIAPGRPLATTYCPIEFEMGNDPIVELLDPYVLQPVVAATVPPVGDENTPRDVVFDGGLVLNLAPVNFAMVSDYEALAGASVDVSATACFADGLALDGAYTFLPEVAVEMGAAVTLPNTSALVPGAAVDLYVLGGLETRLLDGSEVEEGELALIGTATVSPDGSVIVGDVGTRVPYLSWLVWRAR